MNGLEKHGWEKRNGADGYFIFLESWMGSKVKGDEMNYSVLADGGILGDKILRLSGR